jgi:hypothetical protein
LRQTTVLSLPIDEASAKIRTGPPLDDEEDYGMEVWAGVLPLRQVAGPPISDPRLLPNIDPPEYVFNYFAVKNIVIMPKWHGRPPPVNHAQDARATVAGRPAVNHAQDARAEVARASRP